MPIPKIITIINPSATNNRRYSGSDGGGTNIGVGVGLGVFVGVITGVGVPGVGVGVSVMIKRRNISKRLGKSSSSPSYPLSGTGVPS